MKKLKSILEKYEIESILDDGVDTFTKISEFNDDLLNLSLELKQAQNKIKKLQEIGNSVLNNSPYLMEEILPLTRLLDHPLMVWANTFQASEIQKELNDSFEDIKIQDLTKKILANKELAQHLLVKAASFTQKGK
jgi:hypothetical protein